MDQKRILVFTENYLPSVGGLENNTLILCATLSKFGHHVSLITPQKNATPSDNFSVIETSNYLDYFKNIQKNDLIIVNGGIAFKIIIPCLILNKSYLVIYQMASLFNQIHAQTFKIRLTNFISKWMAAKAKLNIGVSKYSYEELKQYFGDRKSAMLINPANPIFENSTLKEVKPLPFNILFTGRLIEGKGIRLIIEAVELLRAENYPINLNIVGSGPEATYINNKLHLSYIRFYPPTNPEGLKKWYHLSHLTVIPSTTHVEGSPLVMAESISTGTPVLVSSQPAMVQSIHHQNLTFITGDVFDLANKVKTLLDPKVYAQVLKQTLNLADDYAYENYSKNLQKILSV